MNLIQRYILLFSVVMVVSYLGNKYYNKEGQSAEEDEEAELIRKYLLQSPTPKIWIYIRREPNARRWYSFQSRMSTEPNNAYAEKCIETIREHHPSYEVVLLSDESLRKMLPHEAEEQEVFSWEERHAWANRSMLRVLYTYGGMVLPSTLMCSRPVDDTLVVKGMVVKVRLGAARSTAESGVEEDLMMGSDRGNEVLKSMIEYKERESAVMPSLAEVFVENTDEPGVIYKNLEESYVPWSSLQRRHATEHLLYI